MLEIFKCKKALEDISRKLLDSGVLTWHDMENLHTYHATELVNGPCHCKTRCALDGKKNDKKQIVASNIIYQVLTVTICKP